VIRQQGGPRVASKQDSVDTTAGTVDGRESEKPKKGPVPDEAAGFFEKAYHFLHDLVWRTTADPEEMEKFEEQRKRFANPNVKLFRPGSGLWNQDILDAAKAFDHEVVLGSAHPWDGNPKHFGKLPQFFWNFFLRAKLAPGQIFILHNRAHSLEMLENFLKHAKNGVVGSDPGGGK